MTKERPRLALSTLQGLPPGVGVLASVAFCVALGFGVVAPALPVFARSFQVSATAASAVISVFALVRLAAASPAGWLVNRAGERSVLATGLAIVAVSSALAGLSVSYTQLLVLRGFGGLGSSMFTVSSMSLLLRSVDASRRARAASVFNGGFVLGSVVGPAIGGLMSTVSMRMPFFVYAGTLMLGLAVVLIALPRSVARSGAEERTADATSAVVAVAHTGTHPVAITDESASDGRGALLRTALTSRPYLAALAVNFANGFTAFGLRSALVPLFVVEALRASAALTGYGLLAAAAFQAAFLLPAGRVADEGSRRIALVSGAAVAAAGMSLLAVSSGPTIFLLSMAVLGVGSAFLGSAPAAIVGDVAGGRRAGPLVAAFGMTSDLGAIIGPVAAGAIVDASGSYAAAFWVGAAVLGASLLLAAAMPARAPARARPS